MTDLSRFATSVVISLMLLAGVASGQPASCLNQSSILVSYWAAEGNANDSADSNNGSLVGSAGFTTGEIGQAFLFNGSADFVSVPNASNLNITGSLTITAWVYLNAYSGEFAPVVSKWDDISGAFRTYFLAVRPDGTLRFDVSTNGGFGGGSSSLVISGTSIPLGTWTFVAGVFDSVAKTLTVYINGVAQGSVATSFSTIFTNTRPLFIGAGDLGSNSRDFLNGREDEVRIFSSVVSAAELLCLAGGASCGHHTVHGHLSTAVPSHSGNFDLHHGQHGHTVTAAAVCPVPHAPGHTPGLSTDEPGILAALNFDDSVSSNGPAMGLPGVRLRGTQRGTVLRLFGSAPPAASGELAVSIGAQAVEVLSSGPSSLDGLWEIDVRVPKAAPQGTPLHVTIQQGDLEWNSLDVIVE